ncbi:hypothetical protein WSM22_10120 [Cytophagales bacterium WSM2-2]|nr:hypothetical protein WSM22_10120 [Cytophagales bacterium WSM2-2]
MEIYIISGLGADERVFKSIDFANSNVNYVKWITPNHNESIEGYSIRLLEQIPAKNPILIGLSFGGMMAMEIAKHIPIKKIILISSAKTKREIPFYFRWIGFLRLHKLVPTPVLKKSNIVTRWFFGAKTIDGRKILREILRETDSAFLKWAIDKIVNWKNESVPSSLIHIHGTEDKIIPIRFVKSDFQIEKGGHLMTLTHSNEISKLLKSASN